MKIDLTNTPGMLYGMNYCVALAIYILTNKKRYSREVTAVILIAYTILMESWMYLTRDIPQQVFLICVSITFTSMLLIVYGLCKISILLSLYYVLSAYLLAEFVTSLQWQLVYFFWENMREKRSILLLPLSLVFTFLIYYFIFRKEKQLRSGKRLADLKVRQLLPPVTIFLIAMVMGNISYLYKNTPFSSNYVQEIFIIRTLADLSGMGMLFVNHMQLCTLKAELEYQMKEQLLQTQNQIYQMSEDSIALVNQKYHDLKHQIAYLKKDITSEKRLESLEKLESEIKSYEAQNKTGNKVLDTILTMKSIQCQQQNIKFTCVADGALLEMMEDMDINSMMGNALDNAIESVLKIEDMNKRMIHMAISKQRAFISICVENICGEEVKLIDGLPVTSKDDRRIHGYGVRSIRSTVRKYGGSMRIHTENNWFELRILIPYVEKQD